MEKKSLLVSSGTGSIRDFAELFPFSFHAHLRIGWEVRRREQDHATQVPVNIATTTSAFLTGGAALPQATVQPILAVKNIEVI